MTVSEGDDQLTTRSRQSHQPAPATNSCDSLSPRGMRTTSNERGVMHTNRLQGIGGTLLSKRPAATRQRNTITNNSSSFLSFRTSMAAICFVSILFWWTLYTPEWHQLATPTVESKFNFAREGILQLQSQVLLLSSHGKLVWYHVESGATHVLHQDAGVYYGTFFGDPFGLERYPTVWVAIRAKQTQPNKVNMSSGRSIGADSDMLLRLNAISGEEYERKTLPSKFTHDVVRGNAGVDDEVWVASTGDGDVYKYTYPHFETPSRTFKLFTKQDHVNTLCPTKDGTVWAMLHNKGESSAVEFNIRTGIVRRRLVGVGVQAHGLVQMPGNKLLVLSSQESALVMIQIPSLQDENDSNVQPYRIKGTDREVIWKSHMPKMFLKGLSVVHNVAYLGLSKIQNRKGRESVKTTLVAIDLDTRQLLWMRDNTDTYGLINVISAPHIANDSTCRPILEEETRHKLSYGDSRRLLIGLGFPLGKSEKEYGPFVGNGVQRSSDSIMLTSSACASTYMKGVEHAKSEGFAYGTMDAAFMRLPLRFDTKRLAMEAQQLQSRIGWTFRQDVMNYFMLLVTQNGVIDDENTIGPFAQVPDRLALLPYTRQVLNSFGVLIGRARYMMLMPGTGLKPHRDRVGHTVKTKDKQQRRLIKGSGKMGYWGRRFRVHIPIISDPSVTFTSNGRTIHMEEGYAYLFDNAQVHTANNPSDHQRVHLTFDTVGSAHMFQLMSKASMLSPVTVAEKDKTMVVSSFHAEEEEEVQEEQHAKFIPVGNTNVEIVTEQWPDASVFTPLDPSQVHNFLVTYLIPMIRGESGGSSASRAVLLDFDRRWGQAVVSVDSTDDNKMNISVEFKRLAEQLVLDVVQLECDHGQVLLNPASTSSTLLTLSDAVESFARMMWYECVGWDQHPFADYGPPCFAPGVKRRPF